MNNYTIGNNETTITLPLDALTAQLKMQGLTLLLNHELPAFAAQPPASEGEWYPGKDYQRLFNRISETNGIALNSDMNEIIRIVHEDFPATLPTREQGAKGCQCKQDYKSVMIAGYTYCQNCGERK